MTIQFRCPAGHHLSVEDRRAGQRVRCSLCKQIVRVPGRPPVALPAGSPAIGPVAPPGRSPLHVGAVMERIGTSRGPSRGLPPALGPPPKRFWERPRRPPPNVPSDAYRADASWLRKARWLALALIGLAGIGLVPVFWLRQWNIETADGWARAVMIAAAVQMIYLAWMLNAPDWASVRVLMFLFALAASGYAVATAMAIATPVDRPMVLGMERVRYSAAWWCALALGTMLAATYLCGRLSTHWRRSVYSSRSA